MRIAFFIGDHSEDDLAARLGWWITRHTQKGAYGYITHCEAIHEEFTDGSVTIAGASLRDRGVRSKRTMLNPAHWLIADVAGWDVRLSIDLLAKTIGAPYDWRGALATRLPGRGASDAWFCNEWVAEPYLQTADTFGPHHLAAICMSAGENVTRKFFGDRA